MFVDFWPTAFSGPAFPVRFHDSVCSISISALHSLPAGPTFSAGSVPAFHRSASFYVYRSLFTVLNFGLNVRLHHTVSAFFRSSAFLSISVTFVHVHLPTTPFLW